MRVWPSVVEVVGRVAVMELRTALHRLLPLLHVAERETLGRLGVRLAQSQEGP